MTDYSFNHKGNYFFIDNRFFLYDNGCLFLWFGDLWIDGEKFTEEHFCNSTDYIMGNITGSGVFICLCLEKSFIECYTTTHNACYVFIYKNKTNITISIGMSGVINEKEKPEVNPEEIKEYVFSNKLFHDKTIFYNVVFFKPGYIEKIDFNLNEVRSSFRCEEKIIKSDNIFSIIKNNILSSLDGRDIGLYYSGGFDSTLLLYTMKEMNLVFSPYYKSLSNFINNGELYIAEEKCKHLGIKLIKVKEMLDYSLDSYSGVGFDFPHQVPICLSYDLLGEKKVSHSPVQFFCGHGGDAVLGQNSIGLSCVDAFKDKGFFKGVKKMAELATLKGITFKEIIMNIYAERRLMTHPAPGKHEHAINIIESIYSKNGVSSNGKMDIVSPLLFENVIACFLGFKSYDHFNANYDRALMREMANERYGNTCFFNCSKQSSSDVIFNILNVKKEQIRYVVNKAKLLQLIEVTDDCFNEKLLYQSCVMHTPKDYLFIHKLYQVAIFLLVNGFL